MHNAAIQSRKQEAVESKYYSKWNNMPIILINTLHSHYTILAFLHISQLWFPLCFDRITLLSHTLVRPVLQALIRGVDPCESWGRSISSQA